MSWNQYEIDAIKRDVRILDVAAILGIEFRSKTTAMCFAGHDKKSPSLKFTPSKNLWHCFGCERGGSAIDLVMQARGLDLKQAVEWLAATFNLWLPGRPTPRRGALGLRLAHSKPSTAAPEPKSERQPDPEVYEWFLGRCSTGPTVTKYLQGRGFTKETIDKFRIKELLHPPLALRISIAKWGTERLLRCGLVKNAEDTPTTHPRPKLVWWDYTILFPFFEGNAVTYIQGRRLNLDSIPAKYVNLKDIHKPIFNRNVLAGLRPGSTIYICQGIPDALAASQRGWNAVGILGATSFRADWVDLFTDLKVIVVPDMDEAGTRFAAQVQQLFKRRGQIVQSAVLPHGKDLCEFLNQK